MKYDAKRRLYFDDRGRAISPATVRKHVNEFIAHEQQQVIEAVQRLLTVAEVEAFFAFMRQKVTGWHSITGVIAYGGEDQVNAERWARINQRILSELGYLADFQTEAQHSFTAAQIIADKFARAFPDAQAEIRQRVSRALFTAAPSEANSVARMAASEVVGTEVSLSVGPEASFLIGGTIEPRSAMYPNAIWATHEGETLNRERDSGVILGRRKCEADGASCDECVSAATEEFIPLDDLEEIGSLQCMNNCRCEFEFGDEQSSFATSEIFSGVIGGQDTFGGSVEIN